MTAAAVPALNGRAVRPDTSQLKEMFEFCLRLPTGALT